ncbi:MAG TPA: S1 RNA-binding domain-containing protein [archaeon]|nr:S1 RNA-binding domain-containing protein [archaeon]
MSVKFKKKGFPEEGDVVLITITRIAPHAAFANLDEYEGLEGILHVSEISKTWVKNIKSHLQTGQQLVAKVFQVKTQEKFIQLSVRRMSEYDMRAKWDQVRRAKKVDNMIDLLVKQTGKTPEQVYQSLLPLEQKFGELYFALEDMKKEGRKAFKGAKFPVWLEDLLWSLVEKTIVLPQVEVAGVIKLESRDGRGIEKVKSVLEGIPEVSYLGSSRYGIRKIGTDYKEAEKLMDADLATIQKRLGKTEVFEFTREKKK